MGTWILSGCCSRPTLSSFIEYADPSNGAAAHVGVHICDGAHSGARVVLMWHMPRHCSHLMPARLLLKVHYGNGQHEEFVYDVSHLSGFRTFVLEGDDYIRKQGILTYRLSLWSGDQEIAVREHHLWTEIIPLDALQN